MSTQHAAYVLHSEDLESDLYAIQAVAGFFGSEDEHSTFRATRCARLTEPPVPSAHEALELRVLDRTGQPVAAYTIGGAEIAEEAEHDGLVDLRVTGYLWDTPRAGTDEIWALWRQSGGLGRGAWSGFSEEGEKPGSMRPGSAPSGDSRTPWRRIQPVSSSSTAAMSPTPRASTAPWAKR